MFTKEDDVLFLNRTIDKLTEIKRRCELGEIAITTGLVDVTMTAATVDEPAYDNLYVSIDYIQKGIEINADI